MEEEEEQESPPEKQMALTTKGNHLNERGAGEVPRGVKGLTEEVVVGGGVPASDCGGQKENQHVV